MVGKPSQVPVVSCTMFQQEEERPIPVRSDDNACPRLAKPDLPMVPRRRIVRHLSHSFSPFPSHPCYCHLIKSTNRPHHTTAPSPPNKPYTTHRLLLGTHTSGQASDYLQIATVQIPSRSGPGADVLDRSAYDDERGELGGHTLPASQARINVVQKINHQGEVNRARYMPQNPDLIATKTVSGEVLVFDRTKHPSEPERTGVCKPDIRLVGQKKEGSVLVLVSALDLPSLLLLWTGRGRESYTDGEYLKGSGSRGTRIRRAIFSARLRTSRCATGEEFLSCTRLISCTDDLRSQGLECLFKGKFDDRASHCIRGTYRCRWRTFCVAKCPRKMKLMPA